MEIKEDGTVSQPRGIHLVYLIVNNDEDLTRLSKDVLDTIDVVESQEALIRGVIVDT